MRRLLTAAMMLQPISLWAALPASHAPLDTLPISEQKIIEIKGVELPALAGKAFSNLTLFAVKQGLLMPIPHQCEDFDDEGYSWFKQGKVPLRGREAIMDAHDSLLFRFADAGDKLSDAQASAANNLVQIRIQDGNEIRYVYMSQQPMRFSHTPLANYDATSGKITTDYFTLQTSPENLLQWSNFTYRHFEGLPNDTLLDTLKIRLDAGVVLNNARVTLDNQNLRTKVVAVKAGPVRTVMLAESSMNFAGIPVVFIDFQLQLYPQQINIDAKVEVPEILKRLLKHPTATVSIDGHNLGGSEFRSSVSNESVTVDGTMSANETVLSKQKIQQNAWIWLSSHKGFDIFSTLYIPPNFNVPVALHYQDSLTNEDPPERFSGQGPNVGYHMRDVPVNDTFHFAFQAWFTDTLKGVAPEQLSSTLARVPQVAANTLPAPGRPLELVQNNH